MIRIPVTQNAPVSFTTGTFTGMVTAGGLTVTGSTVPANGVYLPSGNNVGISSNSTLRLQINDTYIRGALGSPFQSLAASGSDAFQAITAGARIHFSGASDYFSSDGTTITFAGPVTMAGTFNLTEANGLEFYGNGLINSGSGANNPLRLRGDAANGSSAYGVQIGSVNTLSTAGAKIAGFFADGWVTEKAYVDIAGTFNSTATAVGTPASGGTIVTGYNGDHRRGAFKITIAFGDWTAAALTKDVTLGVIPAKARVVSCIADTTVAYAGIVGPVTLTVGKTAGGAEYLASHTVSGATPVKGLADADMGTLLTRAAAIQGGDMASAMWTGTTNYQARLTSASGNLSGMNAGSTTFYLVVEYF